MKRRLLVVSTIALVSVFPVAPGAFAQTEERTVIDDVEFSTGITFMSDGTMLFNERNGVIRTVDADGGSVETLAEVPTVVQGETGLLGITLSPDESSVYVFATELDGESNTVWRVSAGGGEPERVVTGMAASFYHNGGGVAFDEDGMLLVSNGEQHDSGIAQDPDAIGGKVYRFTPDGDVPDDNPFGDSPALAIGLRNPYGLTVDPETGTPWVTENGPSEYDEVNHIVAGGNYGWPGITGPSDNPNNSQQPEDLEDGEYQEPAASYADIIVPTGIAFAGEGANADVAGSLFFASYGEEAIHKLTLNESRDAVVEDEIFHQPGEPVIALAWGPQGLYFSTPDSIRLLAVGGADETTDAEASTGAGGGVDPEPSPTMLSDPEADGSGIGRLLAIAVPILLILGFLATRSRIDRASRDMQRPDEP